MRQINSDVMNQTLNLQLCTPKIPPLQTGDHLSRPEFERRYTALPKARAELLNGVVYMASPLHVSHGIPHAYVMVWLGLYRASIPNVEICDNTSLRLDMYNEVQPDAMLFFTGSAGSRARISAEGYVEGAPELIVEVAASSASYDLYEKRSIYQSCGIQEYIIWQVYDQRLTWLQLQEGEYVELLPDEDGLLRSRIFPGLHLDAQALLNGQLARVLAVVQEGVAK